MLDDMIRQDEMLRDEEAGLQELLEVQFYEQELLMKQTYDTNKRKGPGTNPAATTTASTESADLTETIAEYDRFLAESSLIGNSGLEDAIEASKRSRLQQPVRSGRSVLSIKAKVPEVKKYDYTLPPATGSFIKAKSNPGKTLYLPKKVRTNEVKVRTMSVLTVVESAML
jgi:hypothetical protein